MKFKPGTILSVFSFSISLFVLGFYLIILVHISSLISIVNEKTPFVIELKDSTSSEQLNSLQKELEENASIFEIVFISKEDGLKMMEKQLGKQILEEGEENPFKELIKFKLKDDFIRGGKVEGLIDKLSKKSIVENCIFEKESVSSLKKNLLSLNSIFLFLGVVFIIISFILIYNNLRFILHADRFTIKTMELIGASPSFVKRPYIKLASKIGLFSGVISVSLLTLLLLYLNIRYNIFESFADMSITIPILLGIFIVSLILPPIFINYLVNKYLKLSDRDRFN